MRIRHKIGTEKDIISDNTDKKQTGKSMTIPIGKAAGILGICKKTLIRQAQEWDLIFEWDGRGRRVSMSDIKRLLGR
jgi:YD repeat-containing protein